MGVKVLHRMGSQTRAPARATETGLTTFPRLLLDHAARRPDAPALREKAFGVWQTLTWAELAVLVRELA